MDDRPGHATRAIRPGAIRPDDRTEIDGRTPSVHQLAHAALDTYGHFTVMQIRHRAARGLERHLARLDGANRELFDLPVDERRIVTFIKHALDGVAHASVRVRISRSGSGEPSVMVTVGEPADMPSRPWRLQSVPYLRPVAHLKHLGTFGQAYHRHRAEQNGFDEALLTGPDGLVAEGAITNVGFLAGAEIVWPAAPILEGITMQVLQPALADHGLPSVRRPVRLADFPAFDAVFVTNSRGVAPVGAVDGIELTVDPGFANTLTAAYESVPWDPL